jgi:23S rRNA pseudouridine2605 synthase
MKPLPKQPGRVPLERAFSKLGLASRTQARQWIAEGRVTVDGKRAVDPLAMVIPEKIRIALDGQALGKTAWRVLMLHKPRGIVTTRSDEKDRPTVFSLLKTADTYLHPVGRLDMATTGLLLLTNDTRLSDWLTDPKSGIIRVYLATVEGKMTPEDATLLLKGIEDEGEVLKAGALTVRKVSNRESHLTVELTEGKNREIRRMFKAIGHEVTALKRVAFGGLELGDLPLGAPREVSFRELAAAFPKLPKTIAPR